MASVNDANEFTVLRSQRDRLLEVVCEVGALGALKLPLGGLLREVAVTAQRLVRGSGAVVAILDGDALEYRACAGQLEPHRSLRVPSHASLSGLALEQRALVYSADAEKDSRAHQEFVRQTQAHSILAAPLLHGVDALGVLKVISDRTDAFDEIDEHAVQMCAQFVAGVLTRQQAVEKSERLAAEHGAALRQVQTVLKASPAATIVHDLDGRILMWNPAAERLLGWSEAEVVGKLPAYVPPEEMQVFARLTREIVAGISHPPDGLVRRYRKNGSPVRLRVTGAPLADSSGLVTGVVRVLEEVA